MFARELQGLTDPYVCVFECLSVCLYATLMLNVSET